MKELRIFLTAVMFYTRIPVPKKIGYSSEALNKATRYLPLIGMMVGGTGALAFLAANSFLSIYPSIIAAMIAMIMLTGAFHEDAFSDFCDGFGGGYTKEIILEIMKDSCIGTYGAVSLAMLLLAKLFLLAEFPVSQIPLMLVAAHALSRLMPVLLIYVSTYVRDESTAKSKPVSESKSPLTFAIAVFFGIAPLYFVDPMIALAEVIVLMIIFFYFRYYVHKKIGGYTGDVLGALQQISEVTFYLIFLLMEHLI